MLRLARATVFAVACVAVTAAGHLLAGGAALPLGVLAAGLLAALTLAYALNGRERGPEVVLAATAAAQLGLHQLFSAPAPEMAHDHLNLGMPLAHLTVALLTGWWLHRGESACWLMLRLWLNGLPRVLTLDLPQPVRQAPAPPATPRPIPRWTPTPIHRRGPPQRSRTR
ncbi:MAG: MFS transporter [Nonomuraea sp.]|nr:MFS transporter [Nonomuraea sp.]